MISSTVMSLLFFFYWSIGLELNELSFTGRERIVHRSALGEQHKSLQKLATKQKLAKRLTPDLTLVKAERAAAVHSGKDKDTTKVYVYMLF